MAATRPSIMSGWSFSGDRVLGLVVADWLYTLFPRKRKASSRAGSTRWSRATPAPRSHARSACRRIFKLGKQARADGAIDSDNVLGDAMEALLGALYLDKGLEPARALDQGALGKSGWTPRPSAPKHPKSALQEWAAAQWPQGAGL